jgi:trigger factor
MSDETEEALATLDAEEQAAEEGAGKLVQQVVITDAGPCKKHVKVTVERAAINTRLDEKFSDLMVKTPAHIPGFRPGKAPKQIVQRKFQKEIAAEVKNEVLMASLEQLAEEEKLSPLSPPELDPTKVLIPEDVEAPMIYEFDIEVRPEFDLPEYKGLKIRRPTYTFTDADVAKETRKILEPYGQLAPKPGENPVAEMDDIIVADLVIMNGDKELNRATELRLKVEKRLALEDGVAEDFGKKIVGAKPGDERTVDIKLATDLPNELLRGQVVQAKFKVNDIKALRMPEYTPELLENFGVRSEEQFKEVVASRLERYLEYSQRQAARSQVLALLAGKANWDLPRDLLVRQSRKTLQRRVMEMRQSGMSDEQILGRQRQLEQEAISNTATALKEHFVLQKIAEIEKLEIEDEDIEAEIDSIADRTGESPRKVRSRLQKDDLLESLATELLERNALNLVLQSAEYEDYAFDPMNLDEDAISTVEQSAVKEVKAE